MTSNFGVAFRLVAAAAILFLTGGLDMARADDKPDATVCLSCHGNEGFEMPGADGRPRSLYVQGDKFSKSVHAQFLVCVDCHTDKVGIPHKEGAKAKVDCGMCHSDQKAAYLTSVHGQEAAKGNNKAATCSSCHTKHDIQHVATDEGKLAIVKNCGGCHKENLRSYGDTYHGQVNTLGYTYTAKCFDCHGNHKIQRVNDPSSTVHPANRLKTCQQCHKQATAGFVSFQPHANTHDLARYPLMWIASKFMLVLLVGVFAFFWLHSALWFYREYRDRKEGKSTPHVKAEAVPSARPEKYYQRFAIGWRIAHLCFALSVMTLVLTGMAVLFSDAAWAKIIVDALGGPRVAGLMHRICAAIMLGIFFIHLVYVAFKLGKQWRTFNWLGPDSMVPNLRDLSGAIAMFKWFFGAGPRPVFDRWTYWEKFDYWAVFWGMAIIGGSGLMLAVPNVTASYLPGWVFNIATLIHGEESILAAVFLFTVHFFNNHLRPDKYPPPDIVMFTGAVALEEFRREHALEYQRLVDAGELDKFLVDAPSKPMTIGSRILGIVLICCGLTLLVLVSTGFIGSLTH
jgi:cytochrome b subunit of formate dehydrogenase